MAKQIVGFRTDYKHELESDAIEQRRTLSEVVEFIVDAHYKSRGFYPPLVDPNQEVENRQEGLE